MLTKILTFITDLWWIPVFVPVSLVCLAVIFFMYVGPEMECTKYTIAYGDYRFHVNNYSVSNNSITFQDGNANVILVGNYAIYENFCERK